MSIATNTAFRQRLNELIAAKKTRGEIASAFGVAYSTVCYWLKRLRIDLPAEPTGRPGPQPRRPTRHGSQTFLRSKESGTLPAVLSEVRRRSGLSLAGLSEKLRLLGYDISRHGLHRYE